MAYDCNHPLISSNDSSTNVAWSDFSLINGYQAACATDAQASKDSTNDKGRQSGGSSLASYANAEEDEEEPNANPSTKPVADWECEPSRAKSAQSSRAMRPLL